MKKVSKQLTAAVLALAIVSGALPHVPGGLPATSPGISATAETVAGNISFDSSTKVLTLSGNLSDKTFEDFTAYKAQAESVVAKSGTVMPNNCRQLFSGFVNLESADLSSAAFNATDDMEAMFKGCSSLSTLVLTPEMSAYGVDLQVPNTHPGSSDRGWFKAYTSDFNWDNVTGYGTYAEFPSSSKTVTYKKIACYIEQGSFYAYNNDSNTLKLMGSISESDKTAFFQLDFISDIVTVTCDYGTKFPANSEFMFSDLPSAKYFYLSGADVSEVTEMGLMFSGCSEALVIDLSGWDTSSVTYFGGMFNDCSSLKSLDLSSFNTAASESFMIMFSGCSSLKSLNISSFDLSGVTNSDETLGIFDNCTSLDSLEIGSGFGDVTEGMRLPNSSGWYDPETGARVSGYNNFAVIPAVDSDVTYSSVAGSKAIDLSQLDNSFIASSNPFPGNKIESRETEYYSQSAYTVDQANSGWYDVDNGRFLERGDVFQFGGAYIYILKLAPNNGYFFTVPDYQDLDTIEGKIYDYTHYAAYTVDFEAANLNDDGTLDVYGYIIPKAFSNNYFLDIADENGPAYALPEGAVFKSHEGVNEATNAIVSTTLPSLNITTTATHIYPAAEEYMTDSKYTSFMNCTSTVSGYEVNVDGGEYKDLISAAYEGFDGFYPNTTHTVAVRCAGDTEPFYTTEVTTASAQSMDVSFAHSCSVMNNLSLNFKAGGQDWNTYDTVELYVRWQEFDGPNGDFVWKEDILSEYYTDDLNRCVFYFNNIPAPDMCSRVQVTVYAEKDGKTYASQLDEYSVKEYAYTMLGYNVSPKLNTLLVDMLNYGAQAQIYFNRNTVDLVNAGLTDAQKAYGTKTEPTYASASGRTAVSGATAVIASSSLALESNVKVRNYITFDSAPGSNVFVEYTYKPIAEDDVSRVCVYSDMFVYDEAKNRYLASLDNVSATDFKQPITIRVYDGMTQISDTYTYSIETYAYTVSGLQDSAFAGVKAIISAMMKYSNSARAYFS